MSTFAIYVWTQSFNSTILSLSHKTLHWIKSYTNSTKKQHHSSTSRIYLYLHLNPTTSSDSKLQESLTFILYLNKADNSSFNIHLLLLRLYSSRMQDDWWLLRLQSDRKFATSTNNFQSKCFTSYLIIGISPPPCMISEITFCKHLCHKIVAR